MRKLIPQLCLSSFPSQQTNPVRAATTRVYTICSDKVRLSMFRLLVDECKPDVHMFTSLHIPIADT